MDNHGLSMTRPPSTTWRAAGTLDSLEPNLAKVPSMPRDTSKPLNIVEAISDVALKKVCDNDGDMAIRIGGREIYRSASRLLGIQESRVHGFAVVNHPPIFSVDLKVSEAARFERTRFGYVAFCFGKWFRNIQTRNVNVVRRDKAGLARIPKKTLSHENVSSILRQFHKPRTML